jgi:anti-anti-sigma factor
MKVERQQVGTVDVFTPVGALVYEDAEEFCKLLLERLCSPNPRVVLSLQEVPYMDSTALEGLLDATDDLAERAMSLKLVNVTATCREILELTGLAGRFRFFTDVQDAVKSFL